jgi:hypothetical protein
MQENQKSASDAAKQSIFQIENGAKKIFLLGSKLGIAHYQSIVNGGCSNKKKKKSKKKRKNSMQVSQKLNLVC